MNSLFCLCVFVCVCVCVCVYVCTSMYVCIYTLEEAKPFLYLLNFQVLVRIGTYILGPVYLNNHVLSTKFLLFFHESRVVRLRYCITTQSFWTVRNAAQDDVWWEVFNCSV